jgi:predicted phosphohydrolase
MPIEGKSKVVDKQARKVKKRLLKKLGKITDGPFGMILFYPNKDGVSASHLFRLDDENRLSRVIVNHSHALWQIWDTSTLEELTKFLLDKKQLTFATDVNGNG